MNLSIWLAGVAISLFIVGAAAAAWGQHVLEPDFAYIGALLVGGALVAGFFALCGLVFT